LDILKEALSFYKNKEEEQKKEPTKRVSFIDVFNHKVEISEDLIKFVSSVGIGYFLRMFINIPYACIDINENINNFSSYNIDKHTFIKYLRDLVKRYNINIYKDFLYTKKEKLDDKVSSCVKFLMNENYGMRKEEAIYIAKNNSEELYYDINPSEKKMKPKKEIKLDLNIKIKKPKNSYTNPFLNLIDKRIIFDSSEIDIVQKDKENNVLYHKLSSEKYYNEDYFLCEVLNEYGMFGKYTYIFRNKKEPDKKVYLNCNNNKEVYFYCGPKKYDKMICMNTKKLKAYTADKDDFEAIKSDLVSEPNNERTYYDLPDSYQYRYKMSRDYNLLKKDTDYFLTKMYLDIESYFQGDDERVYKQSVAKSNVEPNNMYNIPITAITMITKNGFNEKTEGVCVYYHMDKESKKKYKNIKLIKCKDERDLLEKFLMLFHYHNPDSVSGWNIYYDLVTIYNRLGYIGCSKYLSPLNKVEVDEEKREISIHGLSVVDQRNVYKAYVQKREPSYKLDAIANKVLKRNKISYKGRLMSLYDNDIETFLDYNINDVVLLLELEEELKHLSQANELRMLSSTDFKKCCDNTKTIISNFYMSSLMKSKFNSVMRTKFLNSNPEDFIGAYVKLPIKGISDWVIDLDYKALYPSVILTYNIGIETFRGIVNREFAHKYIYKRSSIKDGDIVKVYDVFSEKDLEMDFITFQTEYMKNKNLTIAGTIFLKHSVFTSSLYKLVKELVEKRDYFKSLMKKSKPGSKEYNYYNSKQNTYKIQVNSLYGLLGTKSYDYYNKYIAETITLVGQESIKFATAGTNYIIDSFLNLNNIDDINCSLDYILNETDYMKPITDGNILDIIESDSVIYTDTDSIFIKLIDIIKKFKIEKDEERMDFIVNKVVPILENLINKTLLDNMYFTLHELDKNEFYLKLKQEWISKRVLTIGKKKKYVLYKIYEEGRLCDELEVKGIEIIRSDYSKFTRENLENVLPMMLKEETFDIPKFMNYIEDKANEFRTLCNAGSVDIAPPVPYTKPIEEYKVKSANAVSIDCWNILNLYPDKRIRILDKALLFYISSIDINKLTEEQKSNYKTIEEKYGNINYIAVSDELDNLPECFEADTEIILYKGWYKKIEDLFGFMINFTWKNPEEKTVMTSKIKMKKDNNIGKIPNKFLI